MAGLYIYGARVKKPFKKKKLMVSKEAIEQINRKVDEIIKGTLVNAIGDKVKIVKARHVPE